MAIAPEHAELNEHLNAYLDGELDAAARAAFERHLQACAACQMDLDQLRATRTAVQTLSTLRSPRPMTITAPAATGPEHAGGWLGRWLPWTWRLSAFAAAGCVLVGA